MTDTLLETVADGVATLTMNRPEALNAMTPDMMPAALDALTRFANDPDVRAIILTGAGRGFCAGADLKAIASGARRERYKTDGEGPMGPTRLALSKPLIAAVSGFPNRIQHPTRTSFKTSSNQSISPDSSRKRTPDAVFWKRSFSSSMSCTCRRVSARCSAKASSSKA